jgi:hypothetical protein
MIIYQKLLQLRTVFSQMKFFLLSALVGLLVAADNLEAPQ